MNPDDINYYHVATPFTELMYRTAFVQGQLLDALFSVNTSPRFNFTIARKGLRSLGNYQHFLSSSANFRFSTNYKSKNEKYILRTHYVNQNIFSEENGGIKEVDVINFESGNSEFIDRSVFDPQFENANNKLEGKRFYVNQTYALTNSKDSLNIKKWSFGNVISVEDKFYQFKQSSLNTFFGESTNASQINDKVSFDSFLFNFNSSFSSSKIGEITLYLNYRDVNYSYENLAEPNIEFFYESVVEENISFGLDYLIQKEKYSFDFKYESILAGDTKGSLISSSVLVDINNDSRVSLGYSINNNSPNYNYLLYQSGYSNYNWNNNFENINTIKYRFQFDSDKLFKFNFEFNKISNYAYFKKDSDAVLRSM